MLEISETCVDIFEKEVSERRPTLIVSDDNRSYTIGLIGLTRLVSPKRSD